MARLGKTLKGGRFLSSGEDGEAQQLGRIAQTFIRGHDLSFA